MTLAENISATTLFVDGWYQTPRERLIPEIVSLYKESHRLVDSFPYFHDGAGFFVEDPETHKTIHVRGVMDTTSYLGRLETQVFDTLDTWFSENEEGTAVWISPSFEGLYPCSKLMVHQIAYEFGSMRKTLLNSAILFETTSGQTLQLAHDLFPNLTNEVVSSEGLRGMLFALNSNMTLEDIIAQIYLIDPSAIGTSTMTETEIIASAEMIASMIASGVDARVITQKIVNTGLLGSKSFSCPPRGMTFSEMLVGKFVHNCGACGVYLGKVMKAHDRCPICNGEYLGC